MSPLRRKAVELSDQVISGFTNFVLTVLVARSSTVDAFGSFALMLAVVLFWLGLSRAYFGTVSGTTAHVRQAEVVGRQTLGAIALLSPLVITAVALTGFVVGSGEVALVVMMSVGAPIALTQDQFRYCAVSLDRPMVALLSDGVWLGVLLLGLVLPSASTTDLVALWLLGAVAGLLVAWRGLDVGPNLKTGADLLRRGNRIGGSRLAGTLMAQGSGLILSVFVGAVIGLEAVASIQGAGSLMAPVNMLTAFMLFSFTPTLYRSSPRLHLVIAASLSFILGAVAVTTSALLMLLPGLGSSLMGASWAAVRDVLPETALGHAGLAALTAATLVLVVRGQAKAVLMSGLVSAASGLLAGVVTAYFTGRVSLVVGVTSLVACLVAGLVWVVVVRSGTNHERRLQPTKTGETGN